MAWKDHIDEYGVITQLSGEGGDTAQRMGMALFGDNLRRSYGLEPRLPDNILSPKDSIKILESKDQKNRYMRHPDPAHWTSDDDRGTRDQLKGIASCMACSYFTEPKSNVSKFLKRKAVGLAWEVFKFKREIWGHTGFVWKDWKHYALLMRTFNFTKRGYLKDSPFKNRSSADWGGFILFGILFRSLNKWWLRPALWIADIDLLVNSIIRRYIETDDDDVLNHVLGCCVAATIQPTWIGMLANKINKPKDLYSKLVTYFERKDKAGDHGPPMHEIYDLTLLLRVMS